MSKRKSENCSQTCTPGVSLASFDAALDLLACETFTRLDHLSAKFEGAAGIKLNDGVLLRRWEEAVKRYWVMKSMDQLCCGARKVENADGEMQMDAEVGTSDGRGSDGRPLPGKAHPGVVATHALSLDEEREWRRWSPKVGDAVLVELADGAVWPGRIIDKRAFYQGRTIPRGSHFFPVRLYDEDIEPVVTIKSRLIPLSMRSSPPLLASERLLSAYNHAASPTEFDMRAATREQEAAYRRTHPGVGDDGMPDRIKIKADKDEWNKQVNWVMNERRVEKMRAVGEEREKRLREVARQQDQKESSCDENEQDCKKQRTDGITKMSSEADRGGIFKVAWTERPTTPIRRTESPGSVAAYIRPALSTPQRPASPRRFEKRRSGIYTGVGEYSPRQARTYTPPKILPSGDETAYTPPSLEKFDFVSPLGPVKRGKLAETLGRKASLEAVKEEREEDDGWTLVQGRHSKRAGSAPCREDPGMEL